MSTLASVFGYGLLSARAAASVAGRFYYATDTTLMYRDNGSTWDTMAVGTGSMATDALWDTAGDLAVGTGANTGAKLVAVATGSVLRSAGVGVAPAWGVDRVLSDAAVATSQTQSGNNSWADLATVGPAVTVTVPASGKVKITLVCNMSTNNTAGYQAMGVAISGATTQAAGTNNAAGVPMEIDYNPKVASGASYFGATFLQTGLAAGSTTFTAKYDQFGTAGTATYANRYLLVETVP